MHPAVQQNNVLNSSVSSLLWHTAACNAIACGCSQHVLLTVASLKETHDYGSVHQVLHCLLQLRVKA